MALEKASIQNRGSVLLPGVEDLAHASIVLSFICGDSMTMIEVRTDQIVGKPMCAQQCVAKLWLYFKLIPFRDTFTFATFRVASTDPLTDHSVTMALLAIGTVPRMAPLVGVKSRKSERIPESGYPRIRCTFLATRGIK